MKTENAPIGIFDSGIGGLSVAHSVRQLLPAEDIVYIADSANAPYGNKSQEYLMERANQLSEILIRRHCKLVVVACNTATVNTISKLRANYSVPFVGVEPGIKPAMNISNSKIIAVLATQRTLESRSLCELLSQHAQAGKVILRPCPGLAEQVEASQLDSQTTKDMLRHYIQDLVELGVDTLVLGCTHYPFLQPAIESMVKGKMTIINTSQAIAQQVKRVLEKNNVKQTTSAGQEHFLTSANPECYRESIELLWGKRVNLSPI